LILLKFLYLFKADLSDVLLEPEFTPTQQKTQNNKGKGAGSFADMKPEPSI